MSSFPNQNMEAVRDYLRILQVDFTPPSLDFLTLLVRKHLLMIPYENISKLLDKDEDQGLEGYVFALRQEGYGGTCFAKAAAFKRLLTALGFGVRYLAMSDGHEASHVALVVTLSGLEYLVDLGLGAEFAGPFLLAPGGALQTRLGLRDYHFSPSQDFSGVRIWITQGRRVVKSYRGIEFIDKAKLAELWARSRGPLSTMMRHLCLHQVHEVAGGLGARMLWDHSFIEWCGADFNKREVKDTLQIAELAHEHFGISHEAVMRAVARIKL